MGAQRDTEVDHRLAFFDGLQSLQVKKGRSKKQKEKNVKDEWLRELFAGGVIDAILDEYLSGCAAEEQKASAKKRTARFPNLAGFCRYLKIGTEDIVAIAEEYPDAYHRILAVLEDEALNSELSTTLLGAYMKKRLGYEKDDDSQRRQGGDGICVRFEHDIYKDGE